MRMSEVLSLVLIAGAMSGLSKAEDGEAQQIEFFEEKIRPVLVSKCYECHSMSSKEPKGGLLLDTREGTRRGGESGHAVVPANLDESLIISALKYESFEMPPDEQLPADVIADFERWVELGAVDPREGKSAPIRRQIDFEKAREFWSFKPIAVPALPQVENSEWARTEIDLFIASGLEENRLAPVGDAGPTTLARRIYFDLIGMQPTTSEVDRFVRGYNVNPDEAIEVLVDRLLNSSHFGERWGRHWLDVVRYAESTGMERNGTYPHAWRYRDWVIAALNQDKPYDQFVQEQICGDLMPFTDVYQRNENHIATGLLAVGPKSLNETNKEKFQMDVVDEQIDVVSRAFLGLTASCARCHDHKFDPIPQSEYYALAGIFTSTETLYGTGKTNGNRNPGRVLELNDESVKPIQSGGDANNAKLRKNYQSRLKAEQKKLANLKRQVAKVKDEKAKNKLQERVSVSEGEVRKWRNRIKQVSEPEKAPDPNATLAMAVVDREEIANTQLRIRGEPNQRGAKVPRGFLTIASPTESPQIDEGHSGRRELAQWITSTDNPLAARVAVNRIWHHLFGRGIVATVNNFGANGDRPNASVTFGLFGDGVRGAGLVSEEHDQNDHVQPDLSPIVA